MTLFLAALAVLLVGGVLSAALGRRESATPVGAGSAVLGGALGVAAVGGVLLGRVEPALAIPWGAPFGSIELGIDFLSAVFLLPAFVVPALAAVYGAGYLEPWRRERGLGISWLQYNVLSASMALVLAARSALLFLVAWEVMALASFLLVTFEHERLEVRRAGWTYLVATHLGTAALLLFFLLLGRATGHFDFHTPLPALGLAGATASARAAAVAPGALFVLALVGFGTKAGLAPLHVWLPEAHPAAPSHVSAVMSGVMINTGIYGILRATSLLGPPAWWWGAGLLGLGIATALVGVLFALAQQDLKRLLAYSSVENVGVIACGAGMGLLGISAHLPLLALLGFAAALLHTLNHALFKALLFLGAGAVKHATGTLSLDRLGGLGKRMRDTGTTMLAGALAGAALPPLNGFAGELLLFAAGLVGVTAPGLEIAGPAAALVVSLALVGALAGAVLVKVFGGAFLGRPRSPEVESALEVHSPMRVPMHLLAASCLALGLFPAVGLTIVARGALFLATPAGPGLADGIDAAFTLARWAGIVALGVIGTAAAIGAVRRLLLRRHTAIVADTWGCGFEAGAPRAQYTPSSLAQPTVTFFKPVLTSTREALVEPAGFHPGAASLRSETPDAFRTRFWQPLFRRIGGWLERPRALQHGRTHLYLLYIFATLLALLAYMRGWAP